MWDEKERNNRLENGAVGGEGKNCENTWRSVDYQKHFILHGISNVTLVLLVRHCYRVQLNMHCIGGYMKGPCISV